jgi:hypothetical protein
MMKEHMVVAFLIAQPSTGSPSSEPASGGNGRRAGMPNSAPVPLTVLRARYTRCEFYFS